MVAALVDAFFAAKMRDPKISAALYAVSSDVDGWRIAQQTSRRALKEIVAMLETAPEPLTKEPELIASMLQSMMNGVSRKLLESSAPEKNFPAMRQELLFLAEVYIQACTTSVSRPSAVRAAGRISPS
jgi:Tetracyclin repressor-like, C-terminal domain